jgi:AcrR family transcriptional regulator
MNKARDVQTSPMHDIAGQPRRIPTQKRARDRVEKILAVASQLIAEKGSEAMKMSEIVELAGVSFGSLYQYFPDKTAIIRTLADRFNERGHACVAGELDSVRTETDLRPALARIADAYYNFFLTEPVMRDIWAATQADRLLQELEAADTEYLAMTLCGALKRLRPGEDPAALATLSRLLMQLVAAAVRYAISLEREEGDRVMTMFKRSLPQDPFSLLPPRG